jgi:DNA-binding transcriptional MocR family regulator
MRLNFTVNSEERIRAAIERLGRAIRSVAGA